MGKRWRPAVLMAIVLLASCNQEGRIHHAIAAVVPFDEFVGEISQADFDRFRELPGAKVADKSAFEEMRTYLLNHYQGVGVVDSYELDGATFDCTSVQPDRTSPPEAVPPPGQTSPSAGPSRMPRCPQGTIAVRRVTLEQLVRFATLDEFLGKAPGQAGHPSGD